MRRYIGMAAGVGLVAATLSISGALPASGQGALKPLAALIVNDSEQPVPVLPPTPKLRASAITTSGSAPLELPAGVVFTDFVLTSADHDCTNFAIGFFANPGGASFLNLQRPAGEFTTQLHLTTGVRSTVEDPLFVTMPVTCAASIFWSGYEG